jgi:hypothetical protein
MDQFSSSYTWTPSAPALRAGSQTTLHPPGSQLTQKPLALVGKEKVAPRLSIPLPPCQELYSPGSLGRPSQL